MIRYISIVILILFNSYGLWGQTIEVKRAGIVLPTIFTSVSSAIEASEDGDTLIFSPHRFICKGDTIKGKSLYLKGTISGKDTTILDGNNMNRHFVAISSTYALYPDSLIIEDLILCNGKGQEYKIGDVFYNGGSILSSYIGLSDWKAMELLYIKGNTIFRDNVSIANLPTDYALGGAIYGFHQVVIGDTLSTLKKVKFYNNTATNAGAIAISMSLTDYILSSKIRSHFLILQGNVDFENNNGLSSISVGAIGVSNYKINGNHGTINIVNNRGGMVGGITNWHSRFFVSQKVSEITGNVNFANNYAFDKLSSVCGALKTWDSLFINGPGIVFDGNGSEKRGGAIGIMMMDGNCALIMNKVTFKNNYSNGHASCIYINSDYGSYVNLNSCNLYNNSVVDGGATIYNQGSNRLDTIIINNSRLYNPTLSSSTRIELFSPKNLFSSNCWWGKSDTAGVINYKKSYDNVTLTNWAVKKVTVNNDFPIDTCDYYPVTIQLKTNLGTSLPRYSFEQLTSHFDASLGYFDQNELIIDSLNSFSNNYYKGASTCTMKISIDNDTTLLDSHEGLNLPDNSTDYKFDITISPNPTKDILFITGSYLPKSFQYQIFDKNGKLITNSIYNNFTNGIDVGHYQSGVYFLKIILKEGSLSKSFIVQH